MARNRRRILNEIHQVEELIPDVECRGRCAEHSCGGGIDVTVIEQEFITRAGGPMIPPRWVAQTQRAPFVCPALSGDGQCTVYELRPVVCRIWGATEGLECPHGCRPPEGVPLLSMEDAIAILGWVTQLGGIAAEAGVEARLGPLTSLEHAFERARELFGPGGRYRKVAQDKMASGMRAEDRRRYGKPPS